MNRAIRIGILGARGQTGQSVVAQLAESGRSGVAFSRDADYVRRQNDAGTQAIEWHSYDIHPAPLLDAVISTIPVWELPLFFDLIAQTGAGRVVVLSSTSVETKKHSSDAGERRMAGLIEQGESALKGWAQSRNLQWVILRPTMIYGLGRDHNISSLIRFIQRFGFLPVLGAGAGLRQPVHVDDVARAAVAALDCDAAANRDYNLSGGETLSYREICERLFAAMGRRVRIVRIPPGLFRLARPGRRLLPDRLRWLVDMLERMNRDLVFDHSDAARDLDFNPRPFRLTDREFEFSSFRIIP